MASVDDELLNAVDASQDYQESLADALLRNATIEK